MVKTASKPPTLQLIEGQHDLTFVEQLRIFRDRQGWSNEDLGRRLGVTGRTVGALLASNYEPSETTCLLLIALKRDPAIFEEYLKA